MYNNLIGGGSKVPQRYIPKKMSKKEKKQQKEELKKSRKLYKKGKYHTRKKLRSFKSRKSNHLRRAEQIYGIKKMKVTKKLSNKTGCDMKSLRKIVNKGRGAYFSSGSRPNQTAESWGLARLASAITGGKSAKYDYKILQEGCSKNSKALKLAKKTLKKKYYTVKKIKL
jgi:PAB1-binding protein PBP1